MTVPQATSSKSLTAEAIKSLFLELLNDPTGIDPKGAMALTQVLRSATSAPTGGADK